MQPNAFCPDAAGAGAAPTKAHSLSLLPATRPAMLSVYLQTVVVTGCTTAASQSLKGKPRYWMDTLTQEPEALVAQPRGQFPECSWVHLEIHSYGDKSLERWDPTALPPLPPSGQWLVCQ